MTALATADDIAAAVDLVVPARFLGREPSRSRAWHAMRAGGVGGSEAAAVLGLSPWQSPYSLWWAKREGWVTEASPEMEWGHYLEPALLGWYFDHSSGCVEHNPRGGTWAHHGRPWQHANPDALAWSDSGLRVVEAKKASSDDEWGEPGTDQIPVYYRVQVVHYMDVFGAGRADVVVSNLGRAPEVYVVECNPDEARLIRGHVAAFWRSLTHDVEPDLDGHTQTYQTVRKLNPLIDGSDAEISEAVAARFETAVVALRAAEKEKTAAASAVAHAMGEARRAVCGGRRIAYRRPGRPGHPPYLTVAPGLGKES